MKKNDSFDSRGLVRLLEQASHPLRLDEILRQANLGRRLKGAVQEALCRLADEGDLTRLRGGAWAVTAQLQSQMQSQLHSMTGSPGAAPPEAVRARLSHPPRPSHPFHLAHPCRDAGDSVAEQETLTKINHGIPMAFPEEVLAEARRVARAVPGESGEPGLPGGAGGSDRPDSTAGQAVADIRDLALVTIDGEDARDFDDAVFVERQGAQWRLLVAIADVSWYVRPRGRLDREAAARGNSYYFPASVEPMLPEVLSNGLCSLLPGEDRRVMVADLALDAGGGLVASRFYAALMRSRARLDYGGVQAFLDAEPGPLPASRDPACASAAHPASEPQDDPALGSMLRQAAALAALLIERRKARGSLDFAMPEAEFVLQEGRVIDLRNRVRLFSHRLIEAFMLEANEAVAEFLRGAHAAFLYRVHPAPSPEKLDTLLGSLRELRLDLPLPSSAARARDQGRSGMRNPCRNGEKTRGGYRGQGVRTLVGVQHWLPAVLHAAAGSERAWLVNSLALRAMMQARYESAADRHFGLASACYCHFTSPIRRYADLLTHRALRRALGLDGGGAAPGVKTLLTLAEQCNTKERAAQDAEREITRRMGCLVLRGQEGTRFQGVISGVMPFGVFVRLGDKPLEGMIRVEHLGADYYAFDPRRQELRGLRTRQSFRLGDRVEVSLSAVHADRLEIDLRLTGGEKSRPRQGGRDRA